ncbi:MAG: hypothetical protein H6557_20160 [Lewinellaceae bacterium]|nr:hypothetical protein [Phaeodactylibacter sp.]MCB9038933.1 hypothetical protein [Lewinellaceae bacterium]
MSIPLDNNKLPVELQDINRSSLLVVLWLSLSNVFLEPEAIGNQFPTCL